MRNLKPRGTDVAVLRRIWGLLGARRRRQMIWLLGVSLSMGVSTLGGIAAVFPFFAVLAEPRRIEQSAALSWLYTAAGFTDIASFLVVLGLLFAMVVLLANAVNLGGFLAIDRYAQHLAADLHVALFDEYLHRDYLFHARTHSATLYSRIIYDCRRLAVGIVHSALTFVSSALTCVFILSMALLLNPVVALATGLMLGGAYALTFYFVRRRLARNGREQTQAVIDQTRIVNETFAAVKEIQALGNQAFFRDRFRARCEIIARNVGSTAAISHSPRHVAEALGAAGFAGVAIWLSRAAPGGPWIAQLGVLALAMYRLLPAMQLCFASLSRLRADADGFDQIELDLRLGLARSGRVAAPPDPAWQGRPRHALELRDVTVRYGPDLPPALRRISMRIEAGAIVGIVGANGSGKSTLADVLSGVLVPESGSVKIDGDELDAGRRGSWIAATAIVPQHPLLLDVSVAQNVALGVDPAAVDPARLADALRLAGLNDLDDEPVGERGARLNGGQRQKIALARAFYRQAGFLILDEATSALDGVSEREIVRLVHLLRGRCTTLLIAHRLSSVRECDVIFELDAGRISALGTYAELLRSSANFRRLAGETA